MSRYGMGHAAIALSLFLGALFLGAFPALAQDDNFARANAANRNGIAIGDQAGDLFEAHDYAGAEKLYRAAMAQFQNAATLSDGDSAIVQNLKATRGGLAETLVREGQDLKDKAVAAERGNNPALALADIHNSIAYLQEALAYFQQDHADYPREGTQQFLQDSTAILQRLTGER